MSEQKVPPSKNLCLINAIPSSPESPDVYSPEKVLNTNTEHFMIMAEPLAPEDFSSEGFENEENYEEDFEGFE